MVSTTLSCGMCTPSEAAGVADAMIEAVKSTAEDPRHRASLGVEQPIPSISVNLSPRLTFFDTQRSAGVSALQLFPLHLQDSPDGLPSLYTLFLAS